MKAVKKKVNLDYVELTIEEVIEEMQAIAQDGWDLGNKTLVRVDHTTIIDKTLNKVYFRLKAQ